jgi:hypothetical protein
MNVQPVKKKKEFQFQLWFDGEPQLIEFSTDYSFAMLLMTTLQRLQAAHKIPTPPQGRPSGRPTLSIVKLDE